LSVSDYELFNTIAIKNMNVMDVIKECFRNN